jgi:hypothetical protein
LELVSECEDLELKQGSRAQRPSRGSDKRNDDGEHRREAYPRRAAISIVASSTDFSGSTGVDAQFLKNEELLIRRRFELREQAVRWAEEMRTVIEKGGMP